MTLNRIKHQSIMKDCDRCSKGFKREWRFLSEFEKQPGVSGFPDSQSKAGFLLKTVENWIERL